MDRNGQVRFVHYGHDPSDIPANEEIIDLIETMNMETIAEYTGTES
jgi:hypothetical protein